MTIICQCRHITDTQIRDALAEDAQKYYALPPDKRATRVFNDLRKARPLSEAEEKMCEACPKPCYAHFAEIVEQDEAQRCRGYQSPNGCLAADILAGYLHEMK